MTARFARLLLLIVCSAISSFGQHLEFSTIFSNPLGDAPVKLGQDTNGNLYVVRVLFTNTTVGELVITKLDPTGKSILKETHTGITVGPTAPPFPGPAVIDSAGNLYFAFGGNTGATVPPFHLPTTPGAFQPTPHGQEDVYVAKFDANGALLAASFLGGSGNDLVQAIAVDTNGNIVIVGSTNSNDFPLQSPQRSTLSGASDAFVAKFSSTLTSLVFSTYWGETFDDSAKRVAIDNSGAAYVLGTTNSQDFPQINTPLAPCTLVLPRTGPPFPVWFLTKFNTAGVATFSSFFYDPVATCSVVGNFTGLAIDGAGHVFVLFDALSDVTATHSVITSDTTLQAFASHAIPGPGSSSEKIALDANGNLYMTGHTDAGSLFANVGGNSDGFLSTTSTGVTRFSASFNGTVTDILPSSDGSVYLLGFDQNWFINSMIPNRLHGFLGGSTFLTAFSPASGAAIGYIPNQNNFDTIVQKVGTSSLSQPVPIANFGTLPVDGLSVAVTGDFTQTNTCGTTLAANSHRCNISVTFTPTAAGERTGTLTLTSTTLPSPTVIPLHGIAGVPIASLAPSALAFPPTALGSTSAALTVTLTNTGAVPLAISRIVADGDFAETNTCGTALEASPLGSCTIKVTFSPTANGTRTGSLTITDDDTDSPQVIALSGTGGPGPGVTVGATNGDPAPTATVTAGQTASYDLTVRSSTFSGTIASTCTTTAVSASCSVAPSSTPITPGGSVPIKVSVATSAPTTAQLHGTQFLAVVFGLCVFPVGLISISDRRRRRWTIAFFALLIITLFIAALGCGSGGGSSTPPPITRGTPAGSYTVTVTAAFGGATQSMSLGLTVK